MPNQNSPEYQQTINLPDGTTKQIASSISQETFNNIIDEISTTTKSVIDVCKDFGTSYTAFNRYIKEVGTTAHQDYERARNDACDYLEAMIHKQHSLMVADFDNNVDPKLANALITKHKIIIDDLKWLLSKRKSKIFGDRVDVDIDKKIDVSITYNGAHKDAGLIDQDLPGLPPQLLDRREQID